MTDKLVTSRAKAWLRYYNDRLYHVLKHLDKSEYVIIRYENLANDINDTRKKLAAFLEVDGNFDDIDFLYPSKMHIVAGNPIRSKDKMSIRYDERWKERLTKTQIEMLSVINDSLKDIYLCSNI